MNASLPRVGWPALLVVTLAVGTAAAQEDASSVSVRPGQTYPGFFTKGEGADAYVLDLEPETFVFGDAIQRSVDVVVTVFGPDGEKLQEFDGPAVGPETFRFTAEEAGRYRIEISPFEEGEGEYELRLHRVEPLATSPEGKVDQLMAAYDRPETPGGVVAVVRDGAIVFQRAYGLANLTHDVPFETQTRTNIGSTSKQFTAFAIALLAERGELALDDDVRSYIPELPDFGEKVTLCHLLTHTSGYREFLNTILMSGRRIDRGDSISREELIAIVQRQPELQNAPGAEWNYNNTGYGLLTVVVERVTEESFPEWMRANVFEPLGMRDTFVRADPGTIIEDAAQGYVPGEDGTYRIAIDLGGAMGAGGIYTTTADLARWLENFRTHELGSAELFEQMTTPFELTSGEATEYGLGLFIDEHRGLRRIHHGGADTAHRSMMMYFPGLDAGVITLSNNATFDGSISAAVAEAFFETEMEPKKEETAETADATDSFDPESFDPESFDAFAGRYEMEEVPGFIMTFTREEGRYFGQATGQPRLEFFPVSPTRFRADPAIVDVQISFHPEEDGSVSSITVHQNGDHPGKRLPDETETESRELSAYAGRYFSEELETFYTVTVEEDALVVGHRRLDDVKLRRVKGELFSGSMPIAQVEFEIDEETGEVEALRASSGRTRGVRFERVD